MTHKSLVLYVDFFIHSSGHENYNTKLQTAVMFNEFLIIFDYLNEEQLIFTLKVVENDNKKMLVHIRP